MTNKRVSLTTGSKAKKKQVVRKAAKLGKLYRMIQRMDVPVTMKDFLDMAVSIAIDLSFQSRQRWNEDQKKSFLESCVVDLNISKFVLKSSPRSVLVVPAVELGADATRFSSTTLPPIL